MNKAPSYLRNTPKRPEAMEVPDLIEEWVKLQWVNEWADIERNSPSRSLRQPRSYTDIQSERLAPRKREIRAEMERRELLRPRP